MICSRRSRWLAALLRAHVLAYARQRRGEARLVDGLQQVVDGARLERLDGVLIVGGDEHHQRQRFLRQLRQHLEAGHARHLDVEEYQVGLVLLHGRDASRPLAHCATISKSCFVAQADLDPAPRQHLVVDDERADLQRVRLPDTRVGGGRLGRAASLPGGAVSSGSAMSTLRPGCELSTAKR